MTSEILIGAAFITFIFVLQIILFLSRYKRVPPDKILVIHGKVDPNPNVKYLTHSSGAAFVWPVIQDFSFLDTNPIQIEFQTISSHSVKGVLSCRISKNKELTIRAAENFHKKEVVFIKKFVADLLAQKVGKSSRTLLKAELSSDEIQNEIENVIEAALSELGMELIKLEQLESSH